ncbi:WhiB family transcriptional regulator [Streptomyces goshikiensis]|uniref:WhiB family transcriptional regulator n=1 Tax=Streptomyces goshikiensis TaxID=1942 RepID=UPI0036931CD0
MSATLAIVPRWHFHAACSGQPEIFSPLSGEPDTTKAKRICATCPVLDTCLTDAMSGEGRDPQWARAGVRGGLTPRERALHAGAPVSKEPYDYTHVDELLHNGRSDAHIAKQYGISLATVQCRRHVLGIPLVREQRTPQSVYAAQVRLLDDGHAEWLSDSAQPRPQVIVQGRDFTAARLAFLVGHGREGVGNVKVTCGKTGCVAWQHLADKTIREAQAAAAKKAAA